jgi:hypothetical protein
VPARSCSVCGTDLLQRAVASAKATLSAERRGLLLWASSIDVDARMTPLEAPDNPKAAAPEQRVSAQPASQRLALCLDKQQPSTRAGSSAKGAVSARSAACCSGVVGA